MTVLAVNYNQSRWLEEALNSVKDQTYPNIELIILDDYSTDGSQEKIENWIRSNNVNCRFLANGENEGVCKLLNRGLEISTGKFIQLLACDDTLLPTKIEAQVKVLNSNPADVGVAYSDALLIDENSIPSNGRFMQRVGIFFPPPEGYIYNQLIKGNFIPAPSALIRFSVFKELGYFDESLLIEDFEFWLRVSKKYKFVFSQTPSCMYRIHSSSASSGEMSWDYVISLVNGYIKSINSEHISDENEFLTNWLFKMYKFNRKEFVKYIERSGLRKRLKHKFFTAASIGISFDYYVFIKALFRK